METAKAKLTVLFDPPFWVGIFENLFSIYLRADE